MNLIWTFSGNILQDAQMSSPLVFKPTFPGMLGNSQTIQLSSSARVDGSFSILKNLRIYLQGDPAQLDTLLNVWPRYGSEFTPPRSNLTGGLELSFDGGLTFQRLGANPNGQRLGFPDDASTWIPLPASCILPGTVAGVLGALDTATISIRYVIPSLAETFQVFNVRLEAVFDVV